jgi:hypothetical protein
MSAQKLARLPFRTIIGAYISPVGLRNQKFSYFVIRMIDSARYYENEAQVGVGVRQSGVKRENIFISELVSFG